MQSSIALTVSAPHTSAHSCGPQRPHGSARAWSWLYHALLTLLLVAAAGCAKPRQFEGECVANSECPVGAFCKEGLCACRSDEACGPGEICNSQNVCQKRAGCRQNSECPDPLKSFCDLATGACVEKQRIDNNGVNAGCGSNVHCDPGFVCNTTTKICEMGCRDDADCPLYRVCNRVGTSSDALGFCSAGGCTNSEFCEFGQVCSGGMCGAPSDPNHCKPCDNTIGSCGDKANFCLINPNYDPNDPTSGSQNFCGVDCFGKPEVCPSGYNCGQVRILTRQLCDRNMHSQCCAGGDPNECCPDGATACENKRFCSVSGEADLRGACTCLRDSDCSIPAEVPASCIGSCLGAGNVPCRQDSDCPFNVTCDMTRNRLCSWPNNPVRRCTQDADCDPTPFCVPVPLTGGSQCIWSIGAGRTPVACSNNDECRCLQPEGVCIGTSRPCTTSADCNQLTCVGGSCLIGAACAPLDGLECTDVRQSGG